MLDLILAALLVGLGIRGWMRGLVREVISLAVLIVGTVAAFRLSTPVGRVIADMSGVSPDVARSIAGVVVFLAIGIAAGLASRALHLGMRFMPGVSTLNRAAGAALSIIALTLVVTLAVSMATVFSLPATAEEQLEDSAVATALTDPDGIPQRVLGLLSGDRVVELALRIRELTGSEDAVALPDRPLEFPPSAVSVLERLPDAESDLVDLLNRERVGADVDPLRRSSGLDQVAYELTTSGYSTGTVRSLPDGELREVLNEAGMPTTARSMVAVLAASPEAAHAALVDEVSDAMTMRGQTKVGIAVVQGPTGLLIIEVMSG